MNNSSKIVPADEDIDRRRGIDHIGVSATAIIHDGKGNILMMKRGEKARDENGRWDICGGAVEFGERIEETIVREIQEELCSKPGDIKFLAAGDAHRKHKGVQTHWIWLLYSAKVIPETVKIGEPHKIDQIGWFNLSNLPSPLHSQFPNALAAAKDAGIIR
jgi:8-oxo-dGTP diphosphatase